MCVKGKKIIRFLPLAIAVLLVSASIVLWILQLNNKWSDFLGYLSAFFGILGWFVYEKLSPKD